MTTFLVLDLEAPMMSFGGDVVDSRGVVRDFPARSMLTGLLGNALGLERSDAAALDSLQSRIVHATALVRPGQRRREYQTARLFENDAGWTTRGQPEGRAKSPSFSWDSKYEAERGERRKSLTHQRYRDHDADARALVTLTLDPESLEPGLDALADALRTPARPLFIGRKASIPSRPVLHGRTDAPDARAALADAMQSAGFRSARVQWQSDAGTARSDTAPEDVDPTLPYTMSGERELSICDERRHESGVHGGTRTVLEGFMSLALAGTEDDPLEVHSLSGLSGASR